VGQKGRVPGDEQGDVAERDVRDLRLGRQQRDERRPDLLVEGGLQGRVVQGVRRSDQDLDGRQDDRRVGVLQARGDAFGEGFRRGRGGRRMVGGEGVQYEDLAPLRALVQGAHQRGGGGGGGQRRGRARAPPAGRVRDLAQRRDRVGDDHWVGVAQQPGQGRDEAPVLRQVGRDVGQLGHADGGGLADIGVVVLWGGVRVI
jgi:hypothetical protein